MEKRYTDRTDPELLRMFSQDVAGFVGLPPEVIEELSKYLCDGKGHAEFKLLDQWLKSIRSGAAPDYSIYSAPEYTAEAWACWQSYSRKSLSSIVKPYSFEKNRWLGEESLRGVRRIVDVGNGFGLTTDWLSLHFPEARVIGTNIEGTQQYLFAQALAKVDGFEMCGSAKEAGKADLIVALEYFEHFEEPLKELQKIVSNTMPRFLLVANSFGTVGVGHFDSYLVAGKRVSAQAASLLFRKTLRAWGFKVRVRWWNNRPTLWERSSLS